jgi:hypothetical protein
MVELAELGRPQIRLICSAAMHNLPSDSVETTADTRLIKLLMTMLHADAATLSVSAPSFHHTIQIRSSRTYGKLAQRLMSASYANGQVVEEVAPEPTSKIERNWEPQPSHFKYQRKEVRSPQQPSREASVPS